MSLPTDTHVGPCEIPAPFDADGMGEVYEARHGLSPHELSGENRLSKITGEVRMRKQDGGWRFLDERAQQRLE